MGIEEQLKNTKYLNLAPNSKTNASLFLYANDIDIQLISNSLECEPTKSHRRGDIIEYQRKDEQLNEDRLLQLVCGVWLLRKT